MANPFKAMRMLYKEGQYVKQLKPQIEKRQQFNKDRPIAQAIQGGGNVGPRQRTIAGDYLATNGGRSYPKIKWPTGSKGGNSGYR